MISNIYFQLEIYLPLATILFLLTLAIYSWHRRGVPGATLFAMSSFFGFFWVASSLIGTFTFASPGKIFWFKAAALWSLLTTTAVTCFILEYAWPGRWLIRRNLTILFITTIFCIGLVATNDFHHLVWTGFIVDASRGGGVVPVTGPGAWFLIGYDYVLGSLEFIIFAWLFIRSPQHRWPVVVIASGILSIRIHWLLGKMQIIPSETIDLVSVPIVFLSYTIALFAFRVFDPIPLARKTAIEQLNTGVFILDAQGMIAGMNPAAENILIDAVGINARQAQGRSMRDLLPAFPDKDFSIGSETEVNIALRGQQPDRKENRDYTLTASPLKDFRGLNAGRLLLLRDVTEDKRAQVQIVEQQRALAMLQEREHLARELHDSTGQVLSFANLKVGTVRKLISDGKLANADHQLECLENILAEAHADVRGTILDLRFTPVWEESFFISLRKYLDGFRQNYGTQVILLIGDEVREDALSPEIQMQLFRILQEAMSNARKYANADCLKLTFDIVDSCLCMRIEDDGRGFDVHQAIGKDGHFGLRFMHERVEQIQGILSVQSAPGAGTCVEVTVPLTRLAEKE